MNQLYQLLKEILTTLQILLSFEKEILLSASHIKWKLVDTLRQVRLNRE